MICCLCKEREAKVHLSQYIGDGSQFIEDPANLSLVARVDLCNECADQHGVNDLSMVDIVALAKKVRGE